jgi:small multidrug resistance pump
MRETAFIPNQEMPLERALSRRRDCLGNLRDDITKARRGVTRIGPTGAVVVCYAASFALLSLALRGIDLSIAYAVWSGVGTALVAAIGVLWFGESAGAGKLLSLALIVVGVAGLHLSGRAS